MPKEALKTQEIVLKGVVVARGVAIGVPFFLGVQEEKVEEICISDDKIEDEICRYRAALEKSRQDILRLKEDLIKDGMKDGVAVLEAHLQITKDPLLNEVIEEKIRKDKRNVEFVFHSAIKKFRKKFAALKDPFFQSRFEDIHDISKRVLQYLNEKNKVHISEAKEGAIIFSSSLSPSEAAEARRGVGAFVTQVGGQMSHAAIVAKAKGIPFVSNVSFSKIYDIPQENVAIVDGLSGKVILNPSQKTLADYQLIKARSDAQKASLSFVGGAVTIDGQSIRLTANVAVQDDFSLIRSFGAEGVGLFRSEYIVLERGYFPSEEEQYIIYKNLIEHSHGHPVVIRAFDIGLDKVVGAFRRENELNPALGLRAIRFLLHEKELFRIQMRAVLRASASGDVRILFPMISCMNELYEAKQIVQEAKAALKAAGVLYDEQIKIGCMIEVPSAAMIVDLIAKECDFLSIGTNDLTQYALAVDRANQSMSTLYTSAHPGVLRLIHRIVSEAQAKNTPVSVCGEVASDPRFVPFLLGLGITELSISCRSVPLIKHVIRHTNLAEAMKLAKKLMKLSYAQEIQEVLVAEYARNIPPGTVDHL